MGRPIRVEFLVPMEGHIDDDRDASDVLDVDLPDMYDCSDSDDEPDPRCQVALPSRFLRAKQQEKNCEEDRYESDSEGGLDGHSEEIEAGELDSESEIQSVIEQSIPEAGSVAMFNKLSKMADEFMRTVKQLTQ